MSISKALMQPLAILALVIYVLSTYVRGWIDEPEARLSASSWERARRRTVGMVVVPLVTSANTVLTLMPTVPFVATASKASRTLCAKTLPAISLERHRPTEPCN
jgi:hypothetical protein